MAEIPTLYVCHGDEGGPSMHPCRRVQEALNSDPPLAYTTVQTLEIDAVQYALGDGPCLDAARHRRENRVDDLVAPDGRWPLFAKECREDGMRSLLALPLVSGA